MKHLYCLVFVMLTLAISGCNLVFVSTAPPPSATASPTLQFSQPTAAVLLPPTQTPQIHPSPQQSVLDLAFTIVQALKEKDLATLAQFVSPQMGLRFSPYASVKDTDQVFPADRLAGLMADNTAYLWGAYDGSGEPIDLSFSDYYARFVYDADFANATQVSLDFRLGVGNSLDNSARYYADAMIVEFHFPGFDPTLRGMDWRSLRLVFVHEGDAWRLAGIIHDQWTT